MPAYPEVTSARPHPDVHVLRCPASRSGYRNVYYHHTTPDGVDVYVARVKDGGRLVNLRGSQSPRPHECALRVAGWYRERFGDGWRAVALGRKGRGRGAWPWAAAWSPTRAAWPWDAVYSPSRKAWRVNVWEWGRKVVAVRLARGRPWRTAADGTPLGRVAWFRTRGEAERYARVWLYHRWGLFAPLAAWRPPAPGQVPRDGGRIAV